MHGPRRRLMPGPAAEQVGITTVFSVACAEQVRQRFREGRVMNLNRRLATSVKFLDPMGDPERSTG